jgi:hydroxysqualene dehydroxylase
VSTTATRPERVAIVGGGWAGLAVAVRAIQLGHRVSVFEASRQWGGRARTLDRPSNRFPSGLDNGQHILIGAYTATLDLMQQVGVDVAKVLHPMPLSLRFADGSGLAIPAWASRWPAPLDVLAAMACAQGWGTRDKWALLRTTAQWRLNGFTCPSHWTVGDLCQHLPERVLQDMIEPLCVAALNTPMGQASATVFLRVLQDTLLGPGWGPFKASTLLLPRTDLGTLLPQPAVAWLQKHGARCHLGSRVQALQKQGTCWRLVSQAPEDQFDHVVLACPPAEAARLALAAAPEKAAAWGTQALALPHEPIATVYLQAPADWRCPSGEPMLAMRDGPAQFAFHRTTLGGPPGLLALVASACTSDKAALVQAVLLQAATQLRLPTATVLQTVVEKRATFASTPHLQRPGMVVAPGLWAAGEYVAGPYPGTLESAVRSGMQVAEAIGTVAPTL